MPIDPTAPGPRDGLELLATLSDAVSDDELLAAVFAWRAEGRPGVPTPDDHWLCACNGEHDMHLDPKTCVLCGLSRPPEAP